jgi:membrane protein implicated in regulation of membrane protease activity
VVVTFALLLTIADHAGLFGIPLAFILISWLFKYAYILFDHSAWGIDEPPALDIHMLNPADEQRPLAQLAILGLIYGTVKLAQVQLGSPVAVSLAATAALLFPASVAVLGLERNMFKALYPPVLVHMVRGLGATYLVALAVIGAYAAGISALLQWVSFLPLELAIAIFGILSTFSMLGGALYERRHELGIDTHRSPERSAELEHRAELRRSEAVVTEAYGLVRVGSHTRAWSLLQDWLAARDRSTESYDWLSQRLATWSDPRYATRLAQDYVDRLITLGQAGQALDVVGRRLEQDPSFRPRTGATTLKIAQLAVRGGGKPGIARALLTDFATRFEGDPVVAAAEALANELVR